MNKKEIKAREIIKSIGRILLNEWDPIGVKNVPEAQEEYDSYEQIAKHLAQIEDEQMGLGKRKIKDLLPVAKRLLSLDVQMHG